MIRKPDDMPYVKEAFKVGTRKFKFKKKQRKATKSSPQS